MSEMTPERLHEIHSGFQSRRGTDAWGIWPEQAMSDLLAEVDRLRGELEGRTRPTREELADAIETDVQAAVFTAKGVREAALDAIDALVARGWVGVPDNQETQ